MSVQLFLHRGDVIWCWICKVSLIVSQSFKVGVKVPLGYNIILVLLPKPNRPSEEATKLRRVSRPTGEVLEYTLLIMMEVEVSKCQDYVSID